MTGYHTLAETERAVRERLGGIPLHWEQMQAAANLHRAAAAVRLHFENSVLRKPDLTWTAFVVLWVVWIWDELETRQVAAEAGISKGTLTGVVKTLEARGLIERTKHATDGRLVLLSLTPKGKSLMEELFPAFNSEEVFVTERLSNTDCGTLADLLRAIIGQLETNGERRRKGNSLAAPE
jgi:MarR family transcriptional regulator, organic hydroperoxide resistance regulator